MKLETDTNILIGKVVEEIKSNNTEDELTIIFADGSSLQIKTEGREDGSHGLHMEYKMYKPKEKKKK